MEKYFKGEMGFVISSLQTALIMGQILVFFFKIFFITIFFFFGLITKFEGFLILRGKISESWGEPLKKILVIFYFIFWANSKYF